MSTGASGAAIRHHYDVGTEFYRLWLDESLTYTCALWEPGDTLETAQLRKLDDLALRAGASGVPRVLDVGCGWGSLLKRLVDHHDVGRAVGLTLSEDHAAHIRASGDPRVEVRLESWEAHESADPYDAIVSIGAFEHFARYGQRPAAKVEGYRRFFQKCHSLLRPGGRMTLQTVAKGNTPLDRQGLADMVFFAEEIFPETEIPRLVEIAEAAEKIFEVVAVRNHRSMYALTCAVWLRRLRERRSEAVAAAGEEVVRRYERYLEACVRFFETGMSTLLRFDLVSVD